MKDNLRKITVVAVGIILNVAGRYFAHTFGLPIWFDMTGTCIASYYVGLWGGIIAGFANNLISNAYDVTSLIYSLTSVVAAVIIHIFVKRGYMNNALKAIISSFWLGIICTVVSTPLNLIFYDGYSGNMWGDTLVDMLLWYDVPKLLAAMAGEAIVEIVDKQVCVMVAYVAVVLVTRMKGRRRRHTAGGLAGLLMVGILAPLVIRPLSAEAAPVSVFDDNFVGKIYNNTSGMVSSEANVICETDDGYIWIGSYAGLTRYDGKEFEFIREGGLVNVVGMMTDSRGRLWIGTNDAGIARYENGTYTYFTDEEGLPSNSIRCFAEDGEGNVYVGTSDRICRFGLDDTIEVLEQDVTFAQAMVVYKDRLIVRDNKGGVYALDGHQKMSVIRNDDRDYFYYCMAVTSKGLLIGTESGELFVFDVSDRGLFVKERIDVDANEISAVFEDSRNRIWIATESGFGYMDQDNCYRQMHYEGFDSFIDCFLEDYQGNLWITSSRYGVMKLSESPFMNMFEKSGIENGGVNAVVFYEGDYYCGTDKGLVVIDGNDLSGKVNELTRATEGSRVRSILTDTKNRLWVCTYNGLFYYDAKSGIRRFGTDTDAVTSDRFRCITQLEDGTIATGTADGINFIKDGRLTGTLTSEDGLENTQILSIVQGKDKTVWAGSDGSGIYIISDGKLVGNYTVENGLSSNIILRIVPHEDGYLIVTSNALCHIDEDGTIRRLSNFPYFNNYDVVVEGDTAYIPCSAGLYEAPLADLCADKEGPFRLYGASEGLFSGLTANSWNYLSEDGKLYLCSNNGVIVFNSKDKDSGADMKFGIVSVRCDGSELEPSDDHSYRIPANARNLSAQASVRNCAFAEVKVRFYIRELDDTPKVYGWDEVDSIQIFKPDLSEYHICLQILDGTGEKVLQEKVYTLEKETHVWEKPWYRTYLVVVCLEIFIFTIFSIVSMVLFVTRKDEMERLQEELEQTVNEQTEALRKQQIRMKEIFLQTVTALSEAVDAKDRYTSGHSKRVAEYAKMIAARLGKSREEQDQIYRAGLLHDVGKIRIPNEIINKVGRLTDEEYNIIKIHPVTGYHILRGIYDSNVIAIGAKYHHERYDGKGYPNGLVGEKIPEVARILGVADSYDAMTSTRSYRSALPQEVVRSEIENGKGTQFDPKIADIMLQMIDEDKNYTMKQADSMHRRILVVDDEPMNIKLIQHIMRDEPMYEIVSASGGRQALKVLEQQSFDLILLDVNMPEMDGLETLKRIREKYQTSVVLITGDRDLVSAAEFSELGCDDYITKPFLPLLVKEIVHNMTERTNVEN